VEPTFLYQGKLLTAPEAIAQQLNRRSPPQIRLEQVHTISSFAARSPLRGQRSLIVVDGAETLAESAANALLKTLEEPGNALLIVITPSLSDLLPTLVSRCHVIPFQRLAAEDLTRVLQQHGALALPPELISLAQGSPGSALRCWEQWQLIPMDLLLQCQTWPAQLPQALTLGRTIARTLDVPAQLWLIDYLQHYFWQQRQSAYIRQLETLRKQLLSFVQPQLAWEIHLSAFC
jgi:DNA polymerase-3 subunit delta'